MTVNNGVESCLNSVELLFMLLLISHSDIFLRKLVVSFPYFLLRI